MGYGTIDTIEKTARLVIVGTKFLGDYTWREMRIWYSPADQKYFWYPDKGNSCNTFGDRVTNLWDFQNGSKDDALRAVRLFGEDTYGAPDDVSSLWDAVWRFRPEDAKLPDEFEPELKDGESYDYGIVFLNGRSAYAAEETVWGFDQSVIAEAIGNRGYVDYEYMPTKLVAIRRRVIGPAENVWIA